MNKKIEEKIQLRDELNELINREQTIVTEYIDTFELTPMNKFRVLSILVDSRVKKYVNKRRNVIQTIQTLKIKRGVFIKQSYHEQCIEIAFMNNDYEKITMLWCDKYTDSHNSLEKLFLAFQFFIENRTVQFIKKFSNKNCIFEHIECMYGIQVIIAESIYDKEGSILYHKELTKNNNLFKLKKLLMETKSTFRIFMIYLYSKYFPLLSNDILEQILDYTYANYFIK